MTLLTALITTIGIIFGAGMEAGPLGFVLILLLGGAFGIAYAGIGLSIALRTGNAQASQAGFLIFFPLLFLSPAFAPKSVFAGWLKFLATINPVTYILEGMRSLVLDGWQWDQLAYACAAILGLFAFTMTLTMLSLRYRIR